VTSSLPLHPRVPRPRATSLERDILLVQRASVQITELGVELDQALRAEGRPTERLRLVRDATNRITRAANDAIQAYRRARRALDAEAARGASSGDPDTTRARLSAARLGVLAALEKAGMRYPWSEPAAQGMPASK
jgi:hypothetical protein